MPELKYATSYYWRAEDETGPEEESCNIWHATQTDIDHDGDNFASRRDEFEIFCSETLRDAIVNAHYWPVGIEFDSGLSEEELVEAAGIINELLHDEKFCGHFPYQEMYGEDKTFTRDDLKVHVNEIPEPVDDSEIEADDVGDYGES